MSNRKLLAPLFIVSLFIIGSLILVWYQSNDNPIEIRLVSDKTTLNNTAAPQYNSEVQDQFILLTQKINQMQMTIDELQKNALTQERANSELDNQRLEYEQSQDVRIMLSKAMVDAEKMNKIKEYQSLLETSTQEMTDDFFVSLDDSDTAWSAASQASIEDSLALAGDSVGFAQVLESTCKSGVCKLSIGASYQDEDELMAIENNTLIALSKDFPSSRLKKEVRDGQVIFSGYITDGKTKLPRDKGILADGKLTAEEIALITQ